jgi:hypothetical protein
VEEPPSDEDEEAAAARQAALQKKVPSQEAMDKFEEYRKSYWYEQVPKTCADKLQVSHIWMTNNPRLLPPTST